MCITPKEIRSFIPITNAQSETLAKFAFRMQIKLEKVLFEIQHREERQNELLPSTLQLEELPFIKIKSRSNWKPRLIKIKSRSNWKPRQFFSQRS
jgi:hypothetical protein